MASAAYQTKHPQVSSGEEKQSFKMTITAQAGKCHYTEYLYVDGVLRGMNY